MFCLSGKTRSYFFLFKVVKLFNKNLFVFCFVTFHPVVLLNIGTKWSR